MFRRLLIVITGFLNFSSVGAEVAPPYLGFAFDASTVHRSIGIFAPEAEPYWFLGFSAQAGVGVMEGLELRVSVAQGFARPAITTLSADVLYRFSVAPHLSLYAGAGPDLMYLWTSSAGDAIYGDVFYGGAHGVLGAAYGGSQISPFLELRPLLFDSFRTGMALLDLRLGVDFGL